MRPSLKTAAPAIALVVLLVMSVGQVLARQASDSRAPHDHPGVASQLAAPGAEHYSIEGIEAPLSFQQLVQRAEVVAIGTVTVDALVPFTVNTEIAASRRDPRVYANGAYHDATFRVHEYVKGIGAPTISVRWLGSTARLVVVRHGHPELMVGGEYALLLKKGEGVFVGGYEVIAISGAGTVSGNFARFGKHGDVDLSQLRLIARTLAP